MKTGLLLGALWAVVPSVCAVVVYSDDGVLAVTRPKNVAVQEVRNAGHFSNLQVRSTPQTIGTFDLSSTISPGNILSVSTSDGSVTTTITASCGTCFTTGSGVAVSNGVTFDDSEFKNPFTAAAKFFKDPAGLIEGAFNAEMDISVSNFTGHFEFDLTFDASGTYDISIPLPPTPGEVNFPDPALPAPAPSAKVGLVPTIDIVLTVSGTLAMTTGFEFSFPQDALFSIDPIKGNLISTNFGDVQFNALPVQFQSGSGTFTAQLRLGAKLAFDFSAFDSGFTLESGVFSNVPTYSATLAFNATAPCEVELSEFLAVDIGAFATAGVTIDSQQIGVGPSIVTTVATLSLPGTCLSSSATPTPSAAATVSAAPTASISPAATVPTAISTPTYSNGTAAVSAPNVSVGPTAPTYAPTTAAPITVSPTAISTAFVPITQVAMSNPVVPSWLSTWVVGPYVSGTPVAAASTMAFEASVNY